MLYIHHTVIYNAQVRSYLDREALNINATFFEGSRLWNVI